jgi:hypothetical protein
MDVLFSLAKTLIAIFCLWAAAACGHFGRPTAVTSKVDTDLTYIAIQLQDYRSRVGSWPSENCLNEPASVFYHSLGLPPQAVRDPWRRVYLLRLPNPASTLPGYVCTLGADGVPDGYGADRDVVRLFGHD